MDTKSKLSKIILITGSDGFIGKNLKSQLDLLENITVVCFNRSNKLEELDSLLNRADFIFHIAGVNRPKKIEEFEDSNINLTKEIIERLTKLNKKTPFLMTSSAQATLDNPYGKSKKAAEDLLLDWSKKSGTSIYIYRLPGVFGKWSKPNYNSVVATFCYNLSRNFDIEVTDPSKHIELVYIDDVIKDFINLIDGGILSSDNFYTIKHTFNPTLGYLKDLILSFKKSRANLLLPNLEGCFERYMYATYTSFLASDNYNYELTTKLDDRGYLAEFIKSKQFGQIFISKTKPGITRGNHWHHTKIEKFFVISGTAEIYFKNMVDNQEIITYKVSDKKLEVIDIPVGFLHAIKNVGDTDLITIFWASEIFDKNNPDTHYEKVQ